MRVALCKFPDATDIVQGNVRQPMTQEYFADVLIKAAVVVELKAVNTLDSVHNAQCINYLKASCLCRCLLLNFRKPRVEIH
jgi:GxxExxY protein